MTRNEECLRQLGSYIYIEPCIYTNNLMLNISLRTFVTTSLISNNSCIIYAYRAMCMNVCMYHRSETLQYVNKLLSLKRQEQNLKYNLLFQPKHGILSYV